MPMYMVAVALNDDLAPFQDFVTPSHAEAVYVSSKRLQ